MIQSRRLPTSWRHWLNSNTLQAILRIPLMDSDAHSTATVYITIIIYTNKTHQITQLLQASQSVAIDCNTLLYNILIIY